jgi:hypothetical protein
MKNIGHDLSQLGLRKENAFFVDEGREVGAVAGEFGAFVGWLGVAWNGPATPATRLCDVVHLPFPNADLLAQTLAAARAKRDAQLLTCALCGERLTPGHMDWIDDRNVCHGCAETKLGIVH